MDYCNVLPISTNVEAPIGTYDNGPKAIINWPNSYAYVVGMILYLESNTIRDIPFAVHKCARFTHNTKTSHDTDTNRVCMYFQGNKEKVLLFNLYTIIVVEFYLGADFTVL